MVTPPDWQLPPGVPRGTWEYGQSECITQDYDRDLVGHPLFEFDQWVLRRWFPQLDEPGSRVVADLGCGTGRAVLELVRRGYRGLAIDLSDKMLQLVERRAAEDGLTVSCVRANLVELQCLADRSLDGAVSLFSTWGMIRGRENRLRAWQHVRRILKPDGVFVVHVHNYWFNLRDPGGLRWMIGNWLQSMVQRDLERGDKYFGFRDVGGMYLHVFTRRALQGELRRAGFRIREWWPVAPGRAAPLRASWFCQSLRAYGWVVVCSSD